MLSKEEGQPGTPEKPLSDLGRVSYHAYWKSVVLEYLHSHREDKLKLKHISTETGMYCHDIALAFQLLGFVRYVPAETGPKATLVIDWKKVDTHMERVLKSTTRIPIDKECLRWTPLLTPTVNPFRLEEKSEDASVDSIIESPRLDIASIKEAEALNRSKNGVKIMRRGRKRKRIPSEGVRRKSESQKTPTKEQTKTPTKGETPKELEAVDLLSTGRRRIGRPSKPDVSKVETPEQITETPKRKRGDTEEPNKKLKVEEQIKSVKKVIKASPVTKTPMRSVRNRTVVTPKKGERCSQRRKLNEKEETKDEEMEVEENTEDDEIKEKIPVETPKATPGKKRRGWVKGRPRRSVASTPNTPSSKQLTIPELMKREKVPDKIVEKETKDEKESDIADKVPEAKVEEKESKEDEKLEEKSDKIETVEESVKDIVEKVVEEEKVVEPLAIVVEESPKVVEKSPESPLSSSPRSVKNDTFSENRRTSIDKRKKKMKRSDEEDSSAEADDEMENDDDNKIEPKIELKKSPSPTVTEQPEENVAELVEELKEVVESLEVKDIAEKVDEASKVEEKIEEKVEKPSEDKVEEEEKLPPVVEDVKELEKVVEEKEVENLEENLDFKKDEVLEVSKNEIVSDAKILPLEKPISETVTKNLHVDTIAKTPPEKVEKVLQPECKEIIPNSVEPPPPDDKVTEKEEKKPPPIEEKKPPPAEEMKPPSIEEKNPPPILEEKKAPVMEEKKKPQLAEENKPPPREEKPPIEVKPVEPPIEERRPPPVEEKKNNGPELQKMNQNYVVEEQKLLPQVPKVEERKMQPEPPKFQERKYEERKIEPEKRIEKVPEKKLYPVPPQNQIPQSFEKKPYPTHEQMLYEKKYAEQIPQHLKPYPPNQLPQSFDKKLLSDQLPQYDKKLHVQPDQHYDKKLVEQYNQHYDKKSHHPPPDQLGQLKDSYKHESSPIKKPHKDIYKPTYIEPPQPQEKMHPQPTQPKLPPQLETDYPMPNYHNSQPQYHQWQHWDTRIPWEHQNRYYDAKLAEKTMFLNYPGIPNPMPFETLHKKIESDKAALKAHRHERNKKDTKTEKSQQRVKEEKFETDSLRISQIKNFTDNTKTKEQVNQKLSEIGRTIEGPKEEKLKSKVEDSRAIEELQQPHTPLNKQSSSSDNISSMGVYTPDSTTNSVHSLHYGQCELDVSHLGLESPTSISSDIASQNSVESTRPPSVSQQHQQSQQQQANHQSQQQRYEL